MTKASEMVKVFETAIASNVGVAEVTVDGTKVRYDRQQLISEYEFWKRQAAKERGSRPLSRGFDLGTAW